MCRILALVSNQIQREALNDILESFIKSNELDKYMFKLSDGRSWAHDDGWGLAAVGYVDNHPTIAHYKTIEPVFWESSRRIINLYIKKIHGYKPLYMVMHARKSSRGEPYGPEYAHPFTRILGDKIAWFVHNGGVDKKTLGNVLNVYPWIHVDSELLGYYVIDKVLTCIKDDSDVDNCVIDAYGKAREYIVKGSALNTSLLLLSKDHIHLYTTYWVNQLERRELEEYYSIIAYQDTDVIFTGSISIIDYLPLQYTSKTTTLEQGIYKLEPGKISKLESL